MDILEQMRRTFAMTGAIVAATSPDQHQLPTPCADWNVGQVIGHMIGVIDAFADRSPDPTAMAALSDDAATQFATAARRAMAAWSAPGGLDGGYERPGRPPRPWSVFAGINFVDTFTHACDVALATGQLDGIDQDLAEQCLAVAREVIPDAARAVVGFDSERVIDPSRPASERLGAFLGREQTRSPLDN